jgi:hypothetical protein
MRALILVVSAGVICQAFTGESDNKTNVPGEQFNEDQAIHQLTTWIKSHRYYEFPPDCLRAKSVGYKNAGYTIELAAEGCPGNTPAGIVGRWRVDAKTGEIYVQNRAGKYVSLQIENKDISQSPIREAQEVSVQNGNICISNVGGKVKTLTSSGHDSEPVLSPDGKWIVFVRTVPGKKISTGLGDADATDLCQIRADGKNPTALVHPKDSDKMETVLAGFSKPQFSTNGRLVYFLSEAWATSGALHVVDSTNGKEHFVCPALEFEVIPSGEYRD